jgi:hypothetical protein
VALGSRREKTRAKSPYFRFRFWIFDPQKIHLDLNFLLSRQYVDFLGKINAFSNYKPKLKGVIVNKQEMRHFPYFSKAEGYPSFSYDLLRFRDSGD